jgi:hypothetical protein
MLYAAVKTKVTPAQSVALCFLLTVRLVSVAHADEQRTTATSGDFPAPIPWSDIGTRAAYGHGEGLSVAQTGRGPSLRCLLQRLEGEVTAEGLRLRSTITNSVGKHFGVVASSVGRRRTGMEILPRSGTVITDQQTVRFIRPGLAEEYSVSAHGVRQDFVVTERPLGTGPLEVQLIVSGALVQNTPSGAQLVLGESGRKIAYSRLRVTDATGQALPAKMEVTSKSSLAVVVQEQDAVYPVRIDPTFSDANWMSMGGYSGANGPIHAMVVDGLGNLYIGGRFTIIGEVWATNIAKWNGSSWSALGSGVNDTVYALAVSGSELYAGGSFTAAGGSAVNYIAKWDGTNWRALTTGLDSWVHALAVSGTNLYVGGWLRTAGDIPVNLVARWNGTSWSALGTNLVGGPVRALAVSGGDLYAGGEFYDGDGARYIAKWNGSSWTALGTNFLGGAVLVLTASGNDLYAGGQFNWIWGVSGASHIAKWNGTNWSALGSIGSYVHAIVVSGSDLYAGGDFGGVVKWDGNTWSELGDLHGSDVFALAMLETDLYAGGQFSYAADSGTAVNHIARWSGNGWRSVGSGVNAVVHTLAVSGRDVYVGGTFREAGRRPANHIAKWNGHTWSALGPGTDDGVRALAVSGTNLYAGGDFLMAGGTRAYFIAQWDGSNWSAPGSGFGGSFNSHVRALAVLGTDLYAGGAFRVAGGNPANCIARWDGSTWSAVGAGLNASVYALATSGRDLYAAGIFTNATNSSGSAVVVNRIAKWDGNSWSALGSGLDWYVYALAVSGSDVYAAGNFTAAGGSPANRIAKMGWQ